MYMYYGQFASNKMYLFLSYYVDHFLQVMALHMACLLTLNKLYAKP